MRRIKVVGIALLSAASVTVSAQKLGVSKTEINFGNIPMKPRSEKNFTIYNHGEKPMVIKTITTTCNCTKLEWKKSPVMPKDSTIVKVIYIPDETGVFYKKANIQSTAGNQEIIIRGTVK